MKTSRSKKPVTAKVDWEKLARQLQEALAKEMKETERMEKELERLEIELIQASGIIRYLERLFGNDKV